MYAYGLAKLIDKRGIKRNQIAALLKVSRQTLYTKLQDGKFKPNELEVLAKYFEVPVEHFNYDGKILAEEPAGDYTTKITPLDKVKCENQLLREIINNKNKEIERLNREIGKLMSKMEIIK
jgi:dynactin complex subunit